MENFDTGRRKRCPWLVNGKPCGKLGTTLDPSSKEDERRYCLPHINAVLASKYPLPPDSDKDAIIIRSHDMGPCRDVEIPNNLRFTTHIVEYWYPERDDLDDALHNNPERTYTDGEGGVFIRFDINGPEDKVVVHGTPGAAVDWTAEDRANAANQGWMLASLEDGKLAIRCVDDPGSLPHSWRRLWHTDAAAKSVVLTLAKLEDDPTALKALRLIGQALEVQP